MNEKLNDKEMHQEYLTAISEAGHRMVNLSLQLHKEMEKMDPLQSRIFLRDHLMAVYLTGKVGVEAADAAGERAVLNQMYGDSPYE